MSVSNVADLEEPLLHARPGETFKGGRLHPPPAENYWPCVFNLTKAVFGAGMMALPRACSLLGAYLGFGMLGVVGAMTWFSVSRGLVHPAARLASMDSHTRTPEGGALKGYSSIVRIYLGSTATQFLNMFLLANAIGFSVMYVDVIGDVLLGSETSPGVLVEVLSGLHAPGWASAWLLNRPLLLGLLMSIIVGPISLQRNMASLDSLNVIGLAALAALFASMAWLAAAAFLQGAAHALPTWPDFEALGKMADTPALAALSLLPVVLTADSCHLNVMPLASMMVPFSRRSMDSVTAVTMAICTLFYCLFSAAAYSVFGGDLEEDVLKNMNPAALAPLIGQQQALLVSYVVRIAFCVSLLGNTALYNFPLRDALLDVIYANDTARKELAREKHFSAMTVGILLLVYVLAVSVSSMWKVIGFVGSIASTGVSYLFPAMVMYVYARSSKAHGSNAAMQMGATLVFAVGAAIFVNGILRPL